MQNCDLPIELQFSIAHKTIYFGLPACIRITLLLLYKLVLLSQSIIVIESWWGHKNLNNCEFNRFAQFFSRMIDHVPVASMYWWSNLQLHFITKPPNVGFVQKKRAVYRERHPTECYQKENSAKIDHCHGSDFIAHIYIFPWVSGYSPKW